MTEITTNSIAYNYLHSCTHHLLDLLKVKGLDFADICRHADVNSTVKSGTYETLNWENYKKIVAYVDAHNLIPGVGLIIGSRTQLADLSILGFASQSSKTFKESLDLCAPYSILLGWNVALKHTRVDANWSEHSFVSSSTELYSKAIMEQWSMVCKRGIERLLCFLHVLDLSKIHFYFPFKAPKNQDIYREYFGACVLHFGADFCGCRYPAQWDDIELPGHDESMAAFCTQQLALLNNRHEISKSLEIRIMLYVFGRSVYEIPDMKSVADHLNMSASTLRRRLKESGITYEVLIENIRKEMASRLLQSSNLKSEQIAYKLGYRFTTSFHTAFKKWFGCSTREYREQHAQKESDLTC